MAQSGRRPAGKAKKAAPKGSRAKRFWKRLGITALVAFIVVGLSGMGAFFFLYETTDLPDPNSDFQTNTTFIYYRDGEERLGSLAVQNRQTIGYDEMPQLMKDAVVAAENRTFWEDPGFSVTGIARGAFSIATGGELQGGSTITQQYIKILYLDSGQRLSRKVRELMLAIKMGRELPKEEILEGYLNTIYFGRGAYGIQAAARSFFLKDAKDLTLEESAALAAILNNPAAFNPSGGPEKLEKLLGRYQYVLDGMLEMGAITQAEHDRAYPALPEFPEVPINDRYGGWKGFLIKEVEKELEGKGFSEAEIQGGGLQIITTLDKSMQSAAAKTAKEYPKKAAEAAAGDPDPADLHVAITSVDTATGGILALYGGPDYVKNSRNWATTPRAAASTFKAFATVAGLRDGFGLNSVFNGNTFTPRGDTKTIRNEFSHQYGPVTLRRATADSINTAFVDMTEQMDDGAMKVVEAANDAGAPTGAGWLNEDGKPNNRIALGAAEVSPVDMANSYATFANSGERNEAHIVDRVLDRNGDVVYEAEAKGEKAIDENVAANVTDALTAVVSEGTGTRASALGRPVAGKTGTNDIDGDITSAWFVGYTKQISTAVMYVAGDSGVEDLETYKRPQDGTFFGSTWPLMTWVDYMQAATDGMPVEQFDRARDIRPERGETVGPRRSTSPSPSPSPSPSATETAEPTPTPTPTPTRTVTPEPTPTRTTPTPTTQPTATPTKEPTAEPTPTRTQTPAPTKTATPTKTPTAEPTTESDDEAAAAPEP
jgi:membrane peptidoglycan carboxypeptidase